MSEELPYYGSGFQFIITLYHANAILSITSGEESQDSLAYVKARRDIGQAFLMPPSNLLC